MKKITVDKRGNTKVPQLLYSFLQKHPRIASQYTLKMVNNQQVDVVVKEDDVPTQFYEIKIEGDLRQSLNNNRLLSEMREYRTSAKNIMDQFPQATREPSIYLLAWGLYDQITIARMLGMVSERFPWVRMHLSMDEYKGVDKLFELIRIDKDAEVREIPTLIRTKEKTFSLSIEALMNGVSEALANSLSKVMYMGITEWELLNAITDHYQDGKIRKKLASNIYEALQLTWYRSTKPKQKKVIKLR